MSDYTPTTQDIREQFLWDIPTEIEQRAGDAFDRWLTAHDAATRAAALETKDAELTVLHQRWAAMTSERSDWQLRALDKEAEIARLRGVLNAIDDWSIGERPPFAYLSILLAKATVTAEEGK